MSRPEPIGCVFCVLIDSPDRHDGWIDHDRLIVSFPPLNPVAPGHRLFVPRKHLVNAREDPHLTAHTMFYAAQWAQEGGNANIITSIGPDATQTVFHLHIHYVPRREGDGLALPWSPR